MFPVMPTLLAVGVPESAPLAAEKVAQAGLFTMLKASPDALEPETLGT
jgi:hypothetical protein